MSKNTKIYCYRCNKEIKGSFVYISEIDHKYLCKDCFEKEQPKEFAKQINKFKKQIAELVKRNEKLQVLLEEKHREIEKSAEFIDKLTQIIYFYKPSKELAIQELEKVKDWLNEPFDEDGCFKIGGDLIDFIDQQIKKLREEK